MDSLLNLLVLYIIFMVFSSFFKKATTPKGTQKPKEPSSPPSTIAEDFQTKVKHYTRKLDQYLAQQTAQRPPVSPPIPDDSLSLSHDVELPREVTFEATAQEREPEFPLPQPPAQDIVSRSRRQSQIDKTAGKTTRIGSLAGAFRRSQHVLHGIILSEILGPPVSQRPRRFQRKG